ncbi:MAG: gamma-glutamyltransferase family protein [Burkholderiaceae bacterium]|nr:gamma-glutamyltransferase family protein [Burkholderiaceae bacterium]
MSYFSTPSLQRKAVLGRNVVATSQPLATQAGLQALARGGNAIDAALSAAITLTVVEPTMNGIGGDAFALIWHNETLQGLNGCGRAPAAWGPEWFKGHTTMPERGWDSVTVPGQVAAWVDLSERYGQLPFAKLFESAIRYATEGFPVSPVIARQWQTFAPLMQSYPGFVEAFMPGGKVPQAGDIWSFPDQAQTLKDIAATRGRSFYEGELAQKMVDFAQMHGAAMSMTDLAEHQSEWVDSIHLRVKDVDVHEIPPNGQGVVALMVLGILQHAGYEQAPAGSALRAHLEVEAMRLAFADLYAHVAEPSHMQVSTEDLLNPAYLKQRAALIHREQASQFVAGVPKVGGTVYLCTADAQGNMVSYIQSNFNGFGSGVVVPGTGISFQNRGFGFELTPGHPNEVAGRKRPMHTIIPAFITRGDDPLMAFGVMGGNMQAQGHVQMVLRTVYDGLNPQAAIDAPRWRILENGQLTLESHWPNHIVESLKKMGHNLQVLGPDCIDFGSAQAVTMHSNYNEQAVYVGGSDPRRDGLAGVY